MKLKNLIVAILFLGVATASQANTIIDVLVEQKRSIENAYRFGKIQYFDAVDLMREQSRIERYIKKAGKDGVITENEEKKIFKLQRRADHNIWVATSFSSRLNRNSTGFYDPFDPLNRYNNGWNQWNTYGGNGQDCTPTTPTTTPPSNPKPRLKKPIRRN